jgi:hypothetical protein
LKYAAAGLLALGIGGGVAAVIINGHTHTKSGGSDGRPHAKHVRPAHGLMLVPLADPDAHVHDRK